MAVAGTPAGRLARPVTRRTRCGRGRDLPRTQESELCGGYPHRGGCYAVGASAPDGWDVGFGWVGRGCGGPASITSRSVRSASRSLAQPP